jgi:hypothetical protein
VQHSHAFVLDPLIHGNVSRLKTRSLLVWVGVFRAQMGIPWHQQLEMRLFVSGKSLEHQRLQKRPLKPRVRTWVVL